MPGRDLCRTHAVRHFDKLVELDEVVAQGAGYGCASRKIVGDKRLYDLRLETVIGLKRMSPPEEINPVNVYNEVAASLVATGTWLDSLGTPDPPVAIAFGSGPGWASALESALLLKEVAGVPAEGVETREGATSAMMALRPGYLALSLPTGPDPLIDEAEAICGGRGATVVRAPCSGEADRRRRSGNKINAG